MRSNLESVQGLLNHGKAIPTLAHCVEYNAMRVQRGQLPFPDLERFYRFLPDPQLSPHGERGAPARISRPAHSGFPRVPVAFLAGLERVEQRVEVKPGQSSNKLLDKFGARPRFGESSMGSHGGLEFPSKYDYHTCMEIQPSLSFVPRAAAVAMERAAAVAPVVILLGARQTGKTTLVRSLPLLAGRPYLTLDDFDLRMQAEADPESLVARAPALILDEVQRARDLLIAIKRAVDQDPVRTPGRFVLTGSANLLMLERIGETLAGRAVYVTLWPFTRRERLGLGGRAPGASCWPRHSPPGARRSPSAGGPAEDWRAAARLGGLPVPARDLTDDDQRALWFSGYVQTYLERDLQALRAVENLADFRRLMRAACLRIGGLLNQTELSRDVGIVQPQVHRFLNLMEASYQAIRLPAFAVNRTRRLIKAPKLYWSDTALALFLAGETEPRGPHLENLVLADLLAWRDTQARRPEVLYWRTATGLEVDFVVETPARLLPVEIKAAGRVTPADAKGLEAFLDEYADRTDGALLLHGGEDSFPLTRRVLAAPWWRVC